jgi:hypothetical protein
LAIKGGHNLQTPGKVENNTAPQSVRPMLYVVENMVGKLIS